MITIQRERLADSLEELKELFPAHWEELALNKDKVPLDPQYDEYLRREEQGMVLYITVRDEGKIVGYFVGFIAPGLHYQTCLTCTMDIFYVVQDSRGAKLGKDLFKTVEHLCKAEGVQRIFVGSKMHKSADWLFEQLGYKPVETYYSKMLGD